MNIIHVQVTNLEVIIKTYRYDFFSYIRFVYNDILKRLISQ